VRTFIVEKYIVTNVGVSSSYVLCGIFAEFDLKQMKSTKNSVRIIRLPLKCPRLKMSYIRKRIPLHWGMTFDASTFFFFLSIDSKLVTATTQTSQRSVLFIRSFESQPLMMYQVMSHSMTGRPIRDTLTIH
jgi:hypothetical protein